MSALARGSSGNAVRKLQEQLAALGFLRGAADGVFGRKTKAAVAAFQEAYLVDGIADALTISAVELAHEAWNEAASVQLLERPVGLSGVVDAFGVVEYEELDGGYVEITNGWADANIVDADLPVVGRMEVHRKIEPVIRAVLSGIQAKGLDKEIRAVLCWCPRHKMHNPKRGLSLHTWAVAFDVNPSTNLPGTIGDMNPGIVESFERFGFRWGGRWRRRDPMHFDYASGGV